jgi:hypothetical protein
MRLAPLILLAVGAVACGHTKPHSAASPPRNEIGVQIPVGFCALAKPANISPRITLARTEAELAAEVVCPGGPSLAQRLNVEFSAHYVVVATVTTLQGGSATIVRIDDDGATLTVIAQQVGGGCSGIAQPTNQQTFTILVPPKARAVRIEVALPAPGPPCDPRLS